jgi:SAM-dependent methyltransferase
MNRLISPILHKLLPPSLKKAWFAARERYFLFQNPSRAGRFATIYRERMWGNSESASGFGSMLQATIGTRTGMESLLRAHSIGSLLDAPCGDFNWMRQLRFEGQYTGCDIVEDLIAQNQRLYGNERRLFRRLDICQDELPQCDLVLCRECLNHISFDEIARALPNLERAARMLLVITHHPGVKENRDQTSSFRFRPLNFTLSPFGFRSPDALIDEGDYDPGKCLGVWDLRRGGLVRITTPLPRVENVATP